MNSKPVYVCAECYDLDCKVHSTSDKEYQCTMCCRTHLSVADANECCYYLVRNSDPMPASCCAKEVKKIREPKMEYPTALLKGIDK